MELRASAVGKDDLLIGPDARRETGTAAAGPQEAGVTVDEAAEAASTAAAAGDSSGSGGSSSAESATGEGFLRPREQGRGMPVTGRRYSAHWCRRSRRSAV